MNYRWKTESELKQIIRRENAKIVQLKTDRWAQDKYFAAVERLRAAQAELQSRRDQLPLL